MPEPWELTDEEAAAEAAELKERRRAADRAAGRLFSEMHVLLDASDEEIDALEADDAAYVRRYRRHRNGTRTQD